MSPTGNASKDSPTRLLPHQAAFVETVFNPSSKRVIVLRADVGLGKSAALIAVSGRLLHDRPMARALYLVPAGLRLQIAERLREGGVPSLLVDRYRFREILDTSIGEDIWPRGTVFVLSLEFASQPDIRDSLTRTNWDLLIADEAHVFTGARAETLRRIGASAERLIFAAATHQNITAGDDFDGNKDEATVVEWRTDQIVDHAGKKLFVTARPLLHEIPYSPNSAEMALRATVGDLYRILFGARATESWKAILFLRSLESSPAALERVLKRFSVKLRMDGTEYELETFEGEVPEEDTSTSRLDRATREEAAGVALRALQEIEVLSGDSKLAAFGEWLNHLNQIKTPSQRICVIAEFRATLFYIAAEIEGRGLKYQLLHGEMRSDERAQSLQSFSIGNGILVATSAVMTGTDLSYVTDLMLYDIPNGIGLQQVLGRFNRFGRLNELNVHVLLPSNGQTSFVTKSVELLHETLGFPRKG